MLGRADQRRTRARTGTSGRRIVTPGRSTGTDRRRTSDAHRRCGAPQSSWCRPSCSWRQSTSQQVPSQRDVQPTGGRRHQSWGRRTPGSRLLFRHGVMCKSIPARKSPGKRFPHGETEGKFAARSGIRRGHAADIVARWPGNGVSALPAPAADATDSGGRQDDDQKWNSPHHIPFLVKYRRNTSRPAKRKQKAECAVVRLSGRALCNPGEDRPAPDLLKVEPHVRTVIPPPPLQDRPATFAGRPARPGTRDRGGAHADLRAAPSGAGAVRRDTHLRPSASGAPPHGEHGGHARGAGTPGGGGSRSTPGSGPHQPWPSDSTPARRITTGRPCPPPAATGPRRPWPASQPERRTRACPFGAGGITRVSKAPLSRRGAPLADENAPTSSAPPASPYGRGAPCPH
ncbi:hypothetical protein SAMN05216532_0356 [Streptomyces sp. 2231.1]|nr:hypothetical protein SAMN05216532_0356 [Streptomyces sp. 2231.1]